MRRVATECGRVVAVFCLLAPVACSRPSGSPTPVPITTSRELTADQQVRHVLSRLGYGARPGDFARVRALGVDRWIAAQLQPEQIADPDLDSALARFPALAASQAQVMDVAADRGVLDKHLRDRRKLLLTGDSLPGSVIRQMVSADSAAFDSVNRRSQRFLTDLQIAKVTRAVMSERQLLEVMVDFWENHFSVYAAKGPVRYYLLGYDRDVIRPHALGAFRDLLRAVARSPAMLYYLDNWQSGAEPDRPTLAGFLAQRQASMERKPIPPRQFGKPGRGLNENYARELLELHTVGVNGGYTQPDVINVARALTGWSVKEPEAVGQFVFRPDLHDGGAKSMLGLRIDPGRGLDEGDAVLDYLAGHPSTARFIATKLVQRFVSDTAPAALVERAAVRFRETGGNIREVVRTIVTSPEFFSRAGYRAKVKSPFELVTTALRALDVSVDSTARVVNAVAQLGQPLFGHLAPDGYPERGEEWINTGSILNRINFGLRVGNAQYPGMHWQTWLARIGAWQATRSSQVDAILDAVLGGEASWDTREILKRGVNPLGGMAAPAGNRASGGAQPGPASDPPADLAGLIRMVGLALGAPEFQRR